MIYKYLSSICRNQISVQNLNYTTQSFIVMMFRPIDITRRKSLRDKRIAEKITYILSFDSVILIFRSDSSVTRPILNRCIEICVMHNIAIRKSHAYYNSLLRIGAIERE